MSEESLVARLREEADRNWPYALAVSNIGKPETDNSYGRLVTLLREAADALDAAEKERDEARRNALDAVASYILMYGGMSGGPESWADLADAIREDRFGPTDEQARIMHQVLTGGTF